MDMLYNFVCQIFLKILYVVVKRNISDLETVIRAFIFSVLITKSIDARVPVISSLKTAVDAPLGLCAL